MAGGMPHHRDSSDKVLITGDDILIEYVQRVLDVLKLLSDEELSNSQLEKIQKFISHYVWHSKDPQGASYTERIETRLTEMVERRRRLIKYMHKKEGKTEDFESKY